MMTALISAAETLLAAGHVTLNNSRLKVVLPPSDPEQEDDSACRKVVVSGISRTLTTNSLKDVLQNPKVGGGAIEELFHELGEETATVIFKDEKGNF
jgi:hypothetical protein